MRGSRSRRLRWSRRRGRCCAMSTTGPCMRTSIASSRFTTPTTARLTSPGRCSMGRSLACAARPETTASRPRSPPASTLAPRTPACAATSPPGWPTRRRRGRRWASQGRTSASLRTGCAPPGPTCRAGGQLAAAVAGYDLAIADLDAMGRGRTQRAATLLNNLGAMLSKAGQPLRAAAAYERCTRSRKGLRRRQPDAQVQLRQDVARARSCRRVAAAVRARARRAPRRSPTDASSPTWQSAPRRRGVRRATSCAAPSWSPLRAP